MTYAFPQINGLAKIAGLFSLIPTLLYAQGSVFDDPEPELNYVNNDDWVQLIQPDSFDGWDEPPSDYWSVENGVIIADTGSTEPNRPEFIFTERKDFKDYIFTAELKIGASSTGAFKRPNSGLFHRTVPIDDYSYEAPGGYEYDFMSDLNNTNNGSIGNWYARRDLRIEPHTSLHDFFNVNGWNRITIRMIGNTMEYWMNGVKIQHYVEEEMPEYATEGGFALQLHNKRKMRIEMRNAYVFPYPEYHGFGVDSGSEVDLDDYYLADFGANKGNMISRTKSIDLTLAGEDAAPEALYQTARISRKFTYNFEGLEPDTDYNIMFHFVEYKRFAVGDRQFNVEVDDVEVLSNFDIIAEAGGTRYKAVTKTFPFTTDAAGTVKIDFTQGAANKPQVSGIEIFKVQ